MSYFWFPLCVPLMVNCGLEHSLNIAHSTQASELLRSTNCSFACSCTWGWIHKDTDFLSPIPSLEQGLIIFVGSNSFSDLFFLRSYCVYCARTGDTEVKHLVLVSIKKWWRSKLRQRQGGGTKVPELKTEGGKIKRFLLLSICGKGVWGWLTLPSHISRMTTRWLGGW